MKNSIINKIKNAISKSQYKNAFTVFDFLNYGNYETVRKSINRLEKQNFIKKAYRGVYYKPYYSKTLDMWSLADVNDIVHAIARAKGWQICFTNDNALNLMSLSTQIPNVYEYASTGPNKTMLINNVEVRFFKRNNKDFTYDNVANLLIQCMKSIGQDGFDQKCINACKRKIPLKNKKIIKSLIINNSRWIVDKIKSICD